jgi:hypothetical protein
MIVMLFLVHPSFYLCLTPAIRRSRRSVLFIPLYLSLSFFPVHQLRPVPCLQLHRRKSLCRVVFQ